MSGVVLSERQARVRWVTINRPERHNALDRETIFALRDAVTESARDDESRVIVLTGAGVAFSSGADLRAGRESQSAANADVLEDGFNAAIRAVWNLPKPVIAAVGGAAAGFGVVAGFGLVEFYGLIQKRGLVCFRGWGVVGGLLMIGSTFCYLSGLLGAREPPAKANDFETSLLIIFVLGLCVRQLASRHNTAGILAISTTLFGLMYVAWLLNFIQKINFFPKANGTYYVLYFILVTKFSDTGAYAVGSLIGRHKMIPRISPGKTWEGFFFGTAATIFVTFVALYKSPPHHHFVSVGNSIVTSSCPVSDDFPRPRRSRSTASRDPVNPDAPTGPAESAGST